MFQTTNQSWYLAFRSVPQMADDGGTRAKSGKLAALQMLQQVAARARKLSLGELAFSQ